MMLDVTSGCGTFAFEGTTGIGKTALLAEISARTSDATSSTTATLNAAERRTENLVIASIYLQLRDVARGDDAVEAQMKHRAKTDISVKLRKLFAAIAADAMKLAVEKAEETIGVVQEIIGGEDSATEVDSLLESLDGDDKRYFILRFLDALDAAGHRTIVAIDNVDSADESLISLIRFLIKEKPPSMTIMLAYNLESGSHEQWNYILVDVRARSGRVVEIQPLTRAAVGDWFESELGRRPTIAELEQIEHATHNRPFGVELAIAAMKAGVNMRITPDYLDFYRIVRRRLGHDAKAVAELLAATGRDTLVADDLLAAAAAQFGVDDLPSALDELYAEHLLKRDGGHVGFRHSVARAAWLENLNASRSGAVARAWFTVIERYGVAELASPSFAGLLPVVAESLSASKSQDEISKLSQTLISSGDFGIGLTLLDNSWRFDAHSNSGGEHMLQNAILAAETRLLLGKYDEVDEPLAYAELSAGNTHTTKVRVLLIRMKLSLRRNAFGAVRELATTLRGLAADDVAAQAEGELIVNTALRDLHDLEALAESCVLLMEVYDASSAGVKNSIDRALARSFARLGDLDAALTHAETALRASRELDSIRAIGNSHLALAEVRRYRRQFIDSLAEYRAAADIARGISNRDSLLWSLLGQAALAIDGTMPELIPAVLGELESLLAEPGFIHPLETAHAALLRAFTRPQQNDSAELIAAYRSMSIAWPAEYLQSFRRVGKPVAPIPL